MMVYTMNSTRPFRLKKDGSYDLRYKEGKRFASQEKGTKRAKKRVKTKGSRGFGFNDVLIVSAFVLGIFVGTYIAKILVVCANDVLTQMRQPRMVISPLGRTAYAEEVKNEEVKEKVIEELICDPKYKWDCEIMIAIAKSENGYEMHGNTWGADRTYGGNSNGSVDTGIFMINSIHGYSVKYLQNAENNIEIAYEVWLSQGCEAWSDYSNGRYLKYLD